MYPGDTRQNRQESLSLPHVTLISDLTALPFLALMFGNHGALPGRNESLDRPYLSFSAPGDNLKAIHACMSTTSTPIQPTSTTLASLLYLEGSLVPCLQIYCFHPTTLLNWLVYTLLPTLHIISWHCPQHCQTCLSDSEGWRS